MSFILKRKQTGFTIVELLIVIVVIGILAAITIVAYNGIQDKAKFTKILSDIKNTQKVLELYKAQNGTYPVTPSAGWRYSASNPTDYVPSVVPDFANSLPQISGTPTGSNNYIYKSDGASYQLLRFYSGGIPAGEWAQVPSDMKIGSNTDRWGASAP